MKIIFVADTPPLVQTGNEHYRSGMDADFREDRAEWLIREGYARPFEKPSAPSPIEPPPEPMPDYAGMTVAELRPLAHDTGIETGGLRKAELIEALEDAWPKA